MLILLYVMMFYVPRDVGTLRNVKNSITAPPYSSLIVLMETLAVITYWAVIY